MVGNDGRRRPVEIMLYLSRERSLACSIIIQVKDWGLLPLRISSIHTIQMCLKNWIWAVGRVGNTSYSSLSLPIRGYMGNLMYSSRIDFGKICLRLFLNVFNRLRGSVAVTVIGVQHLNYMSMRDRDRLNVLGVRRYEQFAFMDGIIVLHVLLRVFFLGHLNTNNHNYIILHTYIHRQIQIIFLATNHYKPSHKHQKCTMWIRLPPANWVE